VTALARGDAERLLRFVAVAEEVSDDLENVYAKLGVSTRTAAAVGFRGLLDAEAS
jgi:hypothetical protein